MSGILVHTSNKRANSLAIIGSSSMTHTSIEPTWKNVSSSSATYRLNHRKSSVSTWTTFSNISVGGSATKTYFLSGLDTDQAYHVRLQRVEVNRDLIIQTTMTSGLVSLLLKTHALGLNRSTSSTAAVIKWDNNVSGTYSVNIYDKEYASSVSPVQEFGPDELTLLDPRTDSLCHH